MEIEQVGEEGDQAQEHHRDAGEAVFVTAKSFAAGMPELPGPRG